MKRLWRWIRAPSIYDECFELIEPNKADYMVSGVRWSVDVAGMLEPTMDACFKSDDELIVTD